MTEQDLTKKILRNAKQHAQELVTTAEQRAAEQIADAQAQAEQRRATALAQGKANLAYRKEQQQRAYEVTRIKAEINTKQAWVTRAFDMAREKLMHADDHEIQVIVQAYIKKYAQTGDKILIAQNWAHALPDLPVTTAIDSGIIIENQTYRLELDIDSILAELKDPLTPTVAEILGVL